jgi:hypothetical protein
VRNSLAAGYDRRLPPPSATPLPSSQMPPVDDVPVSAWLPWLLTAKAEPGLAGEPLMEAFLMVVAHG